MNDDCKDIIKSIQYLDNVPKQVNIPMTQLLDSYSSVSEQRTKLSKLILEKVDRNETVSHIAKPIKFVSSPIKKIQLLTILIYLKIQLSTELTNFKLQSDICFLNC